MLRIGYLTSQYPAPSHTFIAREVAELRRRGFDVQTFSVRPAGQTVYGPQVDLSTYYILPVRPVLYLSALSSMLTRDPAAFFRTLALAFKHRVPGVKALLLAGAYFVEAMVLAAELRRRGIEHVHNHFANPSATVSMLATRYLGIRWSLTLHAHSETDYPSGNLLGAKLELCDFAACVSNFGRAQACRQVGPEHWHKLFISRCGLDLSTLPDVPVREETPGKRIICVARLSPEKGHSGLLSAFAKLSHGPQNGHELVLVGDGPERDRLLREVEAFGISERVFFKGALPEQETLREIAASDVVVLASFMEGIPVALMEGMSLGKAVVAPNLAGIPDLIESGYNGELFYPADWDSLRVALEKVLAFSFVRNRYGVSGRKTIEHAYEIGIAVEPLVARFALSHSTAPETAAVASQLA
jgi:glycosyltransferase involved in cell wall biosynthesis